MVNSSSSVGEICVSLRQSGVCMKSERKLGRAAVEAARCWIELSFQSNQKFIIKLNIHIFGSRCCLPVRLVKCHKKVHVAVPVGSCPSGSPVVMDSSLMAYDRSWFNTHRERCVNLLINRYTAVMLVNKRWGTSGFSLSLSKLIVDHYQTFSTHRSLSTLVWLNFIQ